ncbi:MAG: hypothetical protein PUD73_01150 [bacterium]|nr:hypothetical protein [bacterium]
MEGLLVGTSVTESAIEVPGYRPSETDDQNNPQPEEISLELAESGNEIIFWYEKQTFTLTYVALPDPVYGVPRRVSGMPTEMTDISYGSSVELAGFPTTGVTYAFDTNGERVEGVWSFRGSLTDSSFGWNSEASLDGDFYSILTDITDNTTLYGQWVFTPDLWG